MTTTERIRAAVDAVFMPGEPWPMIDEVSAAVCEALADGIVTDHGSYEHRRYLGADELREIAADLRGEVRNG